MAASSTTKHLCLKSRYSACPRSRCDAFSSVCLGLASTPSTPSDAGVNEVACSLVSSQRRFSCLCARVHIWCAGCTSGVRCHSIHLVFGVYRTYLRWCRSIQKQSITTSLVSQHSKNTKHDNIQKTQSMTTSGVTAFRKHKA